MVNKKKTLQDIFDDTDDLDLLNVKPTSNAPKDADERLVVSFEEIVQFVQKYGHEPRQGSSLLEHQLYARLKSLRDNTEKAELLRGYDTVNLLQSKNKKIESLNDIFADIDDLLADDSEGLFAFKHVKRPHERAEADFVAKRRPCVDFKNYENLFKNVQKDLKNGQRQLVRFKQDFLRAGDFYVHNGVVLYLESVNFEEKPYTFKSGNRERIDGRTRVIFENGTESNMLYRSLYKLLLDNGTAISKNADSVADTLAENFNNITTADTASGYIYVLTSKNPHPAIRAERHLYKIGYSTTPVEERIKQAAKEPTYLMSDVQIVATYKCFNVNPHSFEQLIHSFFGNVCLDIDLRDGHGKRYAPREWFIVPLSVIDEAIGLLISGEIVGYRYDVAAGCIVLR